MKLKISHNTTYNYENPVELNTHAIFLKPLQRPNLMIENYNLDVFPSPDGLEERSSIEGNPFFQTWFSGLTQKLEINSSFEVTIKPFNPFSFIIDLNFVNNIDPDSEQIFRYESNEEILLYPYLRKESYTAIHDYANREYQNNQRNPIGYLMSLTASVHANWRHIIREEDNLWTPDFTFIQKEGSCRDLSWMLIHMLRMQGMATRFVSGYAYNPELKEGHELHAWVEAYLPGAGWIGIDPSLGLFTDQNYIPLACSSDAVNTLPVHGNYAGTGSTFLSSNVVIQEIL